MLLSARLSLGKKENHSLKKFPPELNVKEPNSYLFASNFLTSSKSVSPGNSAARAALLTGPMLLKDFGPLSSSDSPKLD